jgi:lipoate-protein ligase A
MDMVWRNLGIYMAPAAHIHASQEAITRAVGKGKAPPSIRMVIYEPPAVTIGFFQDSFEEVNVEEVKRLGIDVIRRPTGGGAVLMMGPSGSIDVPGWEIYIPEEYDPRLKNLDESFELLSQPAIMCLRELGLKASFRPKNDIEVNRRKIAGVGQYRDSGGILHTGTLLIDFDVELMLKVLKIPVEKLRDKGIKSFEERVTWIKRELGFKPSLKELEKAFVRAIENFFGVKVEYGTLTDQEVLDFKENLKRYLSPEWTYSMRLHQQVFDVMREVKTPAGLIRIHAKLAGEVLEYVLFTGDFFLHPREALYDLEAYLKWTHIDEVKYKIREFLDLREFKIVGMETNQLAEIIELLLKSALKEQMSK